MKLPIRFGGTERVKAAEVPVVSMAELEIKTLGGVKAKVAPVRFAPVTTKFWMV